MSAPGMFERIPSNVNARGIAVLLQGAYAMLQEGLRDEAAHRQEASRYQSMTGDEISQLTNWIGHVTGLCSLGELRPLYHDAEDGHLPAWTASCPANIDEARQWRWPVVALLAAIATVPRHVDLLRGSSGLVRANAIVALTQLWHASNHVEA